MKAVNKVVRRDSKGFSLIELMVVVGIIGILASLAIPKFSEFQAKARQSEAKTNLNYIATLEEAYSTDNSIYVNFPLVNFATTDANLDNNAKLLGFRPTPYTKLSYGYHVNNSTGTSFSGWATEQNNRVFMCSANAIADVWNIMETREIRQNAVGKCN